MDKRLLYHMTHYHNLRSILENGGLSAYSHILKRNVSYTNMAHQNIQDRRARRIIEVPPGGNLHDYVPFYFATRSPMLSALIHGRVQGFDGNEEDIIYLATRTDIIKESNLPFVFSDGHGIIDITEFYNNLADLDKVDWDIMKERYWKDTLEDPDRERRRQAEFLVFQFVDINYFLGIGVKNEKMKQVVMDILNEYGIDFPVLVRKNFYFGR